MGTVQSLWHFREDSIGDTSIRKDNKMKKLIALILTLLLSAGFCSCGTTVACYPGTSIPDFSAVTGIELKEEAQTYLETLGYDTDNGKLYYASEEDGDAYVAYLKKHGYKFSSEHSTGSFVSYEKGGEIVAVATLDDMVLVYIFD